MTSEDNTSVDLREFLNLEFGLGGDLIETLIEQVNSDWYSLSKGNRMPLSMAAQHFSPVIVGHMQRIILATKREIFDIRKDIQTRQAKLDGKERLLKSYGEIMQWKVSIARGRVNPPPPYKG